MANVSSGIRRKVDDLGRVVIPAGIRRSLNIREGDAVEVSVDGERVVLAKPREACVFCGREDDDLHRFRGRLVCRECVATIGEVDGRLRSAAMPAPPTTPTAVDAPTEDGVAAVPGAATSTPRPGPRDQAPEDRRPPRRDPPTAWPTGPIDGDALAREMARASRARPEDHPRVADGSGPPPDVPDDADDARRPPPYDPASTTAW